MTQDEQIQELQNRCENLENALIDLMTILVDNKESDRDFPLNVGADTQELKNSFENLVKEY